MKAAFDIKPELIGTEVNGVPILSQEQLNDYLQQNKVDVVVLCVPKEIAVKMTNDLIEQGIDAFWNFTNVELCTQVPGVFFENVHFVDTLLTLSYRISRG